MISNLMNQSKLYIFKCQIACVRLGNFRDTKIAIIDQKALKEDDFAQSIQSWISKFCLKHEALIQENYNEFEKNLIRKLKLELMLASKEGFWNIFIGPKVAYVTENVKMEGELTLSVDFSVGKANKGKKTIVMFQKKGDPEAYIS